MSGPPYPESHGLLTGKTVLVTAAAGTGIGFATAKRCAEEGATLAISDKHERRLAESADELGALSGTSVGSTSVMAVPCDVTNEGDVEVMFERVRALFGSVDAYVAGLGVDDATVDAVRENLLT